MLTTVTARLHRRGHLLAAAIVAVLTIALTLVHLAALGPPAMAQPACAMKMTVTTGADDLRAGSTFSAWLIIRQPGSPEKWIRLTTNGDFTFGDGGVGSGQSRIFWVAPEGATFDGSGCPESSDIAGVSVSAFLDRNFLGYYDQWDLNGFVLQDSVNNIRYWTSYANTRFRVDNYETWWMTTNPNWWAPWQRA